MAVRGFHDPEGREWMVWQVIPSRTGDPYLPATMSGGWLCFEATHEKRRLHPFDAEWEGLDEAGLWRLCQSAEPVGGRPRGADAAAPAPGGDPG